MTEKLQRPTMPTDLVGTVEIANRCHVTRQAVSRWSRVSSIGFPEPLLELAMGPVYWWPEVAQWLETTGRTQYLSGPAAAHRINRYDKPTT